MSNTKRAVYAANGIEEIDVTPEVLDELEAHGAVLVLDYPTFVREYKPEEVYGADHDDHYDVVEQE